MEQETRPPGIWRISGFWTIVSIITTVVIGIPTLWFACLAVQPKEPEVAFETITATDIIDISKPLEGLSIAFQGEDIHDQGSNLRIFTIQVTNVGDVDILPNHYDLDDDWGVGFTTGELIEVKLIDASSEYLHAKIVPRNISSNVVAFPKAIFESDAFFVIEALVLHPKYRSPAIHAIGKIAGIDEFAVKNLPEYGVYPSFVETFFPGDLFVQYFRVLIYFLTFTAVVVAIAGIASLVNEVVGKIERQRRRNRIMQTRTMQRIDRDTVKEFFVSRYESGGKQAIEKLQRIVKEPARVGLSTVTSRRHQWLTEHPRNNKPST